MDLLNLGASSGADMAYVSNKDGKNERSPIAS